VNVPRILRRLFRKPYDGLRHFGVVEAGALYRCGQPTPTQLRELIQKHGLKTVIALRGSRGEDDPDSWEGAERNVCEEAGIRFLTIPCNHKNPPTRAQIDEFLTVTGNADQRPALVHCRIGQQRTGLFCALYRVHIQGVAPDEALAEMDALGFGIHHRRHQRLLDAFHTLAKRSGPAD
jgi:tyrosine-protein phosphatase SIW14